MFTGEDFPCPCPCAHPIPHKSVPVKGKEEVLRKWCAHPCPCPKIKASNRFNERDLSSTSVVFFT